MSFSSVHSIALQHFVREAATQEEQNLLLQNSWSHNQILNDMPQERQEQTHKDTEHSDIQEYPLPSIWSMIAASPVQNICMKTYLKV